MRPRFLTRRQTILGLGSTASALGVPALGLPARSASAAGLPPDVYSSSAQPDAMTLDLPQLRYSGNWSPRAGAMRVLARELRLRTRLEPVAEPSTVKPDDPKLFETPFLYVAGDAALPDLGEPAEQQLRLFVDLGGLIVFDAADGGADPTFTNDVRKLLDRIMPGSLLAPVSREHVLYRSFYMIDFPWGRTQVHDKLLAVQEEGRIKVLLMRNDLGGALAETVDGLAMYP